MISLLDKITEKANLAVTCHQCGVTFTAKRSKAMYCSNACKQKEWRHAQES